MPVDSDSLVLRRSGAVGTVVRFSAGDAEASVVFDDENVEGCESIPVKDLNVVRAGFEADPDTPAQPVVAQLLSLLGVLLRSDEVVQALEKAGLEVLDSGIPATMWSRLLSQTLMAVLHLSMHCSDALVAACQEGDAHAGAHVLPALLEVAVRPVKLPALITAQVRLAVWLYGSGATDIQTMYTIYTKCRKYLVAVERSDLNHDKSANDSVSLVSVVYISVQPDLKDNSSILRVNLCTCK